MKHINLYTIISKAYDLLDMVYFKETGRNPREVILNMIPDSKVSVLDMCCGTLSNTIGIAKAKPDIKVVGLDLSGDMLRVAKKKLHRQQIKNVSLKCADATKTKIPSKSFDYIILGLVLHESSPGLIEGVLREARRLLKDDGNLIVLEWEPPEKLYQIIKYFPLYLGERLNCKTFKQFYMADKEAYLKRYGFKVEQKEYCNYTILLKLRMI